MSEVLQPKVRDKNLDRRFLKTKKAIWNALIKLLSSKELVDITIKELAEEADINRKTFYLHYSGIHEVLQEIEDEVTEGLTELLYQYDIWENDLNPYYLFLTITNIINDDINFYKNFIAAGKHSFLTGKIKNLLKQSLISWANKNIKMESEQLDLSMEFVSSGIIAIYISWFENKISMSIERVAQLASDLAKKGISSITK